MHPLPFRPPASLDCKINISIQFQVRVSTSRLNSHTPFICQVVSINSLPFFCRSFPLCLLPLRMLGLNKNPVKKTPQSGVLVSINSPKKLLSLMMPLLKNQKTRGNFQYFKAISMAGQRLVLFSKNQLTPSMNKAEVSVQLLAKT